MFNSYNNTENYTREFFKYGTIALWMGLAAHVLFFIFFYAYGVTLMAFFNLFSIAVFLGSFLLLRYRRFSLILTLTNTEVFLHALFATFSVGLESGFYYYLFFLVILAFVMKDLSVKRKVAKIMAVIALFFLGETLFASMTPTYLIEADVLSFLRYSNLLGFLAISAPIVYSYTKNAIETEEELYYYAIKDQLTGLHNRRYFVSIAKQEFSRRSEEPLSLLLTDIDFFKKINDTYGHECGDDMLIAISEKLQSVLRQSDTLARWGGEEFVYLLPNTPLESAKILAEKLRIYVSQLTVACNDGVSIDVTQTFGVAQRKAGESFDETLARADIALYKGKNSGRNCVVCAQ